MRHILLVEDHPVFRQALALIFAREPDLEVVGQAGSVAEGRAAASRGGFDVALVDLRLPDGDGTQLFGPLRAAEPEATVLVLTANPHDKTLARALDAGADGILSKDADFLEILRAVKPPEGG